MTNNGKRGFSFNRANQLVQSASVSYVYDGYNRRVRQSNASGNHYSVYDAKGTLKQRLTSANARVYSVYLGKQLIAERELSASSNTTRYQHTDVLGSVVGESDSAAALTRSVYQPFGERLGGQKSGVGFTGHLEDPDVGLTYMQQRYYDPVIGRFYSNDPVGFTADNPMMFNRYAYANNNPYKFTDPDGRDPDRLSGAVAGAMLQMYDPAAAAQLASITAAAGDSAYSAGVSAGIQLVEGSSELANGASLNQVASNTVNRANGVEVTNNGSIKNANVGDTVRTPANSKDFVKLKGDQGWKDSKTGDIVKKSDTNHSKDPIGEFKFGPKPNKPPTPSNKITVTISNSKVHKIDN